MSKETDNVFKAFKELNYAIRGVNEGRTDGLMEVTVSEPVFAVLYSDLVTRECEAVKPAQEGPRDYDTYTRQLSFEWNGIRFKSQVADRLYAAAYYMNTENYRRVSQQMPRSARWDYMNEIPNITDIVASPFVAQVSPSSLPGAAPASIPATPVFRGRRT